MRKLLVSKKFRVISLILLSVTFFTTCINNHKTEIVIKNASGEAFATSSSCKSCHKKMYDQFIKTAHYYTSQIVAKETVFGSFIKGQNLFSYSYYSKVAMEERDSGLYQIEYDKNFHQKQAYKFDIIIGSGTRGQSYLSWVDKKLIQLPVSYFSSANAWANSPGYPYFQPIFSRTISARCVECHGTYFKTIKDNDSPAPEFDQNQIIYGVQCESCHGPAQKHVTFHQQHLNETIAKFIINPSVFSRQQKLDLCGLCHGGIRKSEKPAFGFLPGDTLAKSQSKQDSITNVKDVEVHDNQYALLSRSKCFRMSSTMTCNTCHNTHEQERGNLALFSKKCMSCHNNENGIHCKMTAALGNTITQNCIDCHMPQRESKMLTLQLEGKNAKAPSTLRSHVIAVYNEETKKFLAQKK